MRMEPASGARSEASMSSSVVFPDPFGPTSAVTRPGAAVKPTSRTACTVPNERRRSDTTMPPASS